MFLRLKHGAIIESNISLSANASVASEQANLVHQVLNGRKLHEITSECWTEMLRQGFAGTDDADGAFVQELADYLGDLLGWQ